MAMPAFVFTVFFLFFPSGLPLLHAHAGLAGTKKKISPWRARLEKQEET